MAQEGVHFDIAVRLKPPDGDEPTCVVAHGREVVVEKGAVSCSFNSRGHLFRSDAGLQAQEEVFAAVRENALDVLQWGGTTALVCFGGRGSGKSYTLFGKIDEKSPVRKSRPATPRDGLRMEGLLMRFATHLLPSTLSFLEVTSLGERCLLTGSSSSVTPFHINDTTTLARLTSRALGAASPGSNLMATLHQPSTGGILYLIELGSGQADMPIRQLVTTVADSKQLIYPLEEEIRRHAVTTTLSPLVRSCNYGFAIACIDPGESHYTTTLSNLRFVDKWLRVPLCPIPAQPQNLFEAPSPRQPTPQTASRASPSARASSPRKVAINSRPGSPSSRSMLDRSPSPHSPALHQHHHHTLAVHLEEELRLRRDAEDSLQEVRKLLVETQQELKSVQAAVQKSHEARRLLEDTVSQQDMKIRQLKDEVVDVSSTAKQLTSSHAEAEQELTKLEFRARKGSEVRMHMNQEMHDLESAHVGLKAEVEQLKSDLQASRADCESMRSHAEEADARSLEAMAEKAQADLQITQLKAELKSLHAEVVELRRAPAVYEDEINRITRDERGTRLQVAKLAKERKTLQHALATLKEELDRSQREWQARMEALELEIEKKEKETKALKDDVEQVDFEAQEELARQKGYVASLNQQHTDEVQKLKHQLSDARVQVKQVRQAADETIDALSDSLNKTIKQLQVERSEASKLRKALAAQQAAQQKPRVQDQDLNEARHVHFDVNQHESRSSSLLAELARE